MTSPTTAAAPTATTTMRAVVQDGYGAADVLRHAEVPVPRTLKDDEVLVRVHAAGLDRGTWHLMTGTPYAVRLVMGLRRPKQPVLGLDLAGTVAAVGSAVTRFAVGDEVYGIGSGQLRRVRRRAGGQARGQARQPHLRAGSGDPGLRDHGPPGGHRHRAASRRASASSSPAPRAGSAASPSRSPSPPARRSPA